MKESKYILVSAISLYKHYLLMYSVTYLTHLIILHRLLMVLGLISDWFRKYRIQISSYEKPSDVSDTLWLCQSCRHSFLTTSVSVEWDTRAY